jgi:hypothetical protein
MGDQKMKTQGFDNAPELVGYFCRLVLEHGETDEELKRLVRAVLLMTKVSKVLKGDRRYEEIRRLLQTDVQDNLIYFWEKIKKTYEKKT